MSQQRLGQKSKPPHIIMLSRMRAGLTLKTTGCKWHSVQIRSRKGSALSSKSHVIVDPVHHESTVIFFHDRHDDITRYRSVFTLLGQVASKIRLIAPRAPLDPDTDVECWSPCKPNNGISLEILDLIHKQLQSSENIFLAGYGEGADLALKIGLDKCPFLKGIVALSATSIPAVRQNQVPVLAFHGQHSETLSIDEARRMYKELGHVNLNVDLLGGHTFRHEMFQQHIFTIK